MKFPIREGVLTNLKGDVKQVADLKFMPKSDFKEQYPTLQMRFQFLRQIYVDSVEYTYAFTQTSNMKLAEKVDDMKKMSKDPLLAEFEQVFDNAKAPMDKYAIKLSATDLPPVVPKEGAEGSGQGRELQIIEAIKNVHGTSIDEVRFIEIMKQNSIEESQAKELFVKYKG